MPSIFELGLEEMMHEGTQYDELQESFRVTMEYGCTFWRKIPLFSEAGRDVYDGWKCDESAPPAFWFARRQEIIDGKAPDILFIPLKPDLDNLGSHPLAVLKAIREQFEAKRKYGDNFRFVFVEDGGGKYSKIIYTFNPGRKLATKYPTPKGPS